MIQISELERLFPKSVALRLRNASCEWHNKSTAPVCHIDQRLPWNTKTILEEYAFCLPDSTYFLPQNFDLTRHKPVFFERYGGEGVSKNGGGARVNVFHPGIQAKGGGKNCLAGQETDLIHSWGGMIYVDAIMEAMYSEVLAELLPCGAARSYAIIDTGIELDNTVIEYRTDNTKSALLIREHKLRPAHLLIAAYFRLSESASRKMLSEHQRIWEIYKVLDSKAIAGLSIERAILDFLCSCAKQMAFAGAYRISHGALGPSNICIDAAWIDFATASFLPPGYNYVTPNLNLPFSQEHTKIRSILGELLAHIHKFTSVKLDSVKLNHAYSAWLTNYSALYNLDSLGWSEKYIEHAEVNVHAKDIIKATFLVAQTDSVPTPGFPDVYRSNEFETFIVNLYLSFGDKQKSILALSKIAKLQNKGSAYVKSFRLCTKAIHKQFYSSMTFTSFLICHFIFAYKKLRLTEFMYRGKVIKYVERILAEDRPMQSEIDQYISFSKSIFDCGIPATIYCTRDISIVFDPHDSVFRCISEELSINVALKSPDETILFLRSLPRELFLQFSCDFSEYLDDLFTSISALGISSNMS
ncbi:MAG: hypothetical protein ACJAYF_003662 [Arenicella sp.]|jgi:hypothetical protein